MGSLIIPALMDSIQDVYPKELFQGEAERENQAGSGRSWRSAAPEGPWTCSFIFCMVAVLRRKDDAERVVRGHNWVKALIVQSCGLRPYPPTASEKQLWWKLVFPVGPSAVLLFYLTPSPLHLAFPKYHPAQYRCPFSVLPWHLMLIAVVDLSTLQWSFLSPCLPR